MPAHDRTYVLITAAYNEGGNIAKTIESVLGQTLPPARWVIVSDGSTDATDEVVGRYAGRCDYIRFVRREKDRSAAGFSSKVGAVNLGYRLLAGMHYSFIGNLDGDVSFCPDYFESLLHEFDRNGRLGIGGGMVLDVKHGHVTSRSTGDLHHVAGAVQLFRRQCYEAIGGYVAIPTGGEDTIAVMMARMKGWDVEVFPRLEIHHHKSGSDSRGLLRESYRDGAKDYALGSHPLFQIMKSVRRIRQKPFALAAMTRMAGFFCQYLCRPPRPVNDEFVKFFRAEQGKKLRSLFS